MNTGSSLPPNLTERYRSWKGSTYEQYSEDFRRLMAEGQKPGAMIIACCDSRVAVEQLFGPGPGEIFVHRNIANLVPRPRPDSGQHGTAAAVEYAVEALRVSHLVVMGHSACGGVRGCLDMCEGSAPQLLQRDSYVGGWVEELRPAHARVSGIEDIDQRQTAMEKEGVRMSLENLMEYPFVAKAVAEGRLSLHGLWIDIAEGRVENYDGPGFSPV